MRSLKVHIGMSKIVLIFLRNLNAALIYNSFRLYRKVITESKGSNILHVRTS